MDTEPLSETQARAEQLLREAQVHRLRKQWSEAEALCRRALELAPEDAAGQEMLADLLAEKGNLDEALAFYRKALERQPHRAAIETKIARLALEKEREERERLAAQLLLEAPKSRSERRRNRTIALLLSLLCPGAGQWFLGQHVKGGLLAAAGLLSLFFGIPELFKLLYVAAGGSADSPASGGLAALGVAGILVWLYSLLDASAQAGRGSDRGDL